MTDFAYSDQERDLLLKTAADSIDYGLRRRKPLPVVRDRVPASLWKPGACFVTLHLHGELRGCMGSTHAYRPLIQDVTENAFAASRRDPRFAPLNRAERPDLELSLSILSEPEPMAFHDEEHLLEQWVPGRDGIILEDGDLRATFLPQVWEQLPDKHDFLAHLKRKAGMHPGPASPALRAYRYRVLHIP